MSGSMPAKLSDLKDSINTKLVAHQQARQEEITRRVEEKN